MAFPFSENIPVFLIVALCSFLTGYLFRYFQINRAPVAVQHPQVQGHVPAIGENAMAQGHVPAINDPELRQPLLPEIPINNVPAPAQELQQDAAAVILQQEGAAVILQQEGDVAIEVPNAVGLPEIQQEGEAAIQALQQEGQEPANGAGEQLQGEGNNMRDEVRISRCHLLVNVLAAIMLPISILTCPWARKELGKTTTFNGFLIYLALAVGVGLVDGYALHLVDKYKQILVIHQHRIHLGIVRDIIDVCLLGLGLFIQQQVDEKCGIWCLWILGSFFTLFISFILITKPTTVLGIADFAIGILAVLLVFLAKTKIGTGGFTVLQQLALMITSSLAIVLALLYRNHYEQVMGGNDNPITCYGWLSARVSAIWNWFV